MKKKGLIISTVVMAVVLIASLTTATYAWFSASAVTSVEQITLTTSAADGLLIGVHKSNASTASSVFQDYTNGADLVFATTSATEHYAGTWTGGTDGFGLTIGSESIQDLNSSYGVQYTTEALTNTATADNSVAANNWFKAEGASALRATIDMATVSYATANEDFVVLDLGCTASKNDLVKQAYCTVKVTVPDKANPGMAAAVNFGYALNNSTAVAYSDLDFVDAFSGMTQSNGYDQDELDAGSIIATEGSTSGGSWEYTWMLYDESDTMVRNADIARIYLVIFLDGDDDACIISNLETGCTIDITFGYTQKVAGEVGSVSVDEKGVLTEKTSA